MSDLSSAAIKIADNFGILGIIFFLSPFIFSTLYCIKKAGSAHFFFDRLWKIIGGDDSIKNIEMREAWECVRDIELFRYRTDIKIESIDDFVKIIKWATKKRISIYQMTSIGRFFDVSHMDIANKNYRRKLNSIGLLCIILILVSTLSTSYYIPHKEAAWLYIKESKLGFKLYEKTAIVGNFKIDEDVCKNKAGYQEKINSNSISNNDLKILCKAINNAIYDSFKKTIKLQWYIYILLMIPTVFYTIVLLINIFRYDKLIKFLHDHIIFGPKKFKSN